MEENKIKGSKILLVEDEETMAIGLEYNLTDEGYVVEWAKNGRDALNFYDKGRYDLIILDIMLPYFSGFEIAKEIRSRSPKVPILFLTARTSSEDRVRGLELGADDYITKPFDLREFLLRVRRMLLRGRWYSDVSKDSPKAKIGDCVVDFDNLTVKSKSRSITLTSREAVLLRYFLENSGRVISRGELLENVWHLSSEVETRTVDIFVSRLRKYFEPDPDSPIYFKSIRGEGYLFDKR
ncbi:MAG: response regulator transcription factor [Ignavibacteriaceae bacterium]|nr:response regulator transcription factor [Ignavibacteriaceae bacterium]